MCISALIGAGGALAGGLIAGQGSRDAGRAQQRAARDAAQVQWDMFDRARTDLAPYREAGSNALAALRFETGTGPRPGGYRGFEATPGYDFRMQEGMDAYQRAMAARGLRDSGAVRQGLMEFGQNIAADEYGTQMNRLAALAGIGQTGATGSAGLASQTGANVGNTLMAGGAARASSYANMANAAGNALGNIAGFAGYGLTQRQPQQPATMPTPQQFGMATPSAAFAPARSPFAPGMMY